MLNNIKLLLNAQWGEGRNFVSGKIDFDFFVNEAFSPKTSNAEINQNNPI